MDDLLQFLLDRGPALVRRWQFPPQKIGVESDGEHHAATARNAYAIAWLLRHHGIRKRVDAGTVSTAAGRHDESELITGDLPSPLKALFKNARRTVAVWERRSLPQLGARGETPAMRFGRVIHISCDRLLACMGAQSARRFDTARPKE